MKNIALPNTINALSESIFNTLDDQGKKWLSRNLGEIEPKDFFIAFSATPRITGKIGFEFTAHLIGHFSQFRQGWTPNFWTIDEAVRVLLLASLPIEDKDRYLRIIKDIFKTADAGELRALYLALPFLSFPEEWVHQTTEGLRSNIKEVFEAISINNPYPSEFLLENAWNQMVLKTIFTGSSISKIYNFDTRVNPELSRMLIDFAHERWAAGREVNPELWRGVAPFAEESSIKDLEKLFESDNVLEKEAAALICSESNVPTIQKLLDQHTLLKSEITTRQLTWDKISLGLKRA